MVDKVLGIACEGAWEVEGTARVQEDVGGVGEVFDGAGVGLFLRGGELRGREAVLDFGFCWTREWWFIESTVGLLEIASDG